MRDVADIVQIKPRINVVPVSKLCRYPVINIVNVDAHLKDLCFILFKVWFDKDWFVSRDDNHPVGMVLGFPVPGVQNEKVEDGSEAAGEDQAADGNQDCRIAGTVFAGRKVLEGGGRG